MNCEHIFLHDMKYLANGTFYDQFFFHLKNMAEYLSCSMFMRNRENNEHRVRGQGIAADAYLHPLSSPYTTYSHSLLSYAF